MALTSGLRCVDLVATFGETPLPSAAWEPLRVLLDSSYLLVLALAGASLFVQSLRRGAAFVAILATAWTAVHIAFFGEPRYHLPMLVAIVPLAAATVLAAARALYQVGPKWTPVSGREATAGP